LRDEGVTLALGRGSVGLEGATGGDEAAAVAHGGTDHACDQLLRRRESLLPRKAAGTVFGARASGNLPGDGGEGDVPGATAVGGEALEAQELVAREAGEVRVRELAQRGGAGVEVGEREGHGTSQQRGSDKEPRDFPRSTNRYQTV